MSAADLVWMPRYNAWVIRPVGADVVHTADHRVKRWRYIETARAALERMGYTLRDVRR